MNISHAQMNQQIINSIVNNGVDDNSMKDIKSQYKSSWFIVQMIMIKIQSLSDQLNDSYIKANEDISDIDDALNRIKNDVNAILNGGKADPAAAKNLADDVAKYKAAIDKYKDDKTKYETPQNSKAWSFDAKDADNIDNMINGQASGKTTIGDLINEIENGNPAQQAAAEKTLGDQLTAWAKVHHDHPDGTNSGDILSQWLNGGSVSDPSAIGINPLITELDGTVQQNTDQVNKYATIINTEYQAGQGVLKALQAFGDQEVGNQRTTG